MSCENSENFTVFLFFRLLLKLLKESSFNFYSWKTTVCIYGFKLLFVSIVSCDL